MARAFARVAQAIVVLVCGHAAPAGAAALSYISASGVDTGDCSNAATPCRTLGYAIPKTSAGGEIKALTAGSYGPPIITKSLTLTGVPGAMIVWGLANGNAVTVGAGAADVVAISGFTVNGLGVGEVGVKVNSVGSLVIRDCTIKNFAKAGIQLASIVAMKFSIEDTFIANIGNYGVRVGRTGGGSATGIVHRSTIIGPGASGVGVFVERSANVRISDSLIGHFEYGVYSGANFGNVLRLTRNTVSQNVKGVSIEKNVGAVAETAKDNFIAGNTSKDIDTALGAPLTNVGTQ